MIFYRFKTEDIQSSSRKGAIGLGVGGANLTVETERGVSGVPRRTCDAFKYRVAAGEYLMVNMLKSGTFVEEQILCGVFLPEQLPEQAPERGWFHFRSPNPPRQRSQFFLRKELINKNTIFAVLPRTISDWSSDEGQNTTKKLAYDAMLPAVTEFLLNH